MWDDMAVIVTLEGLPEEFRSRKEHILNTKDITVEDMRQILVSGNTNQV